jgi:hypothetical protein
MFPGKTRTKTAPEAGNSPGAIEIDRARAGSERVSKLRAPSLYGAVHAPSPLPNTLTAMNREFPPHEPERCSRITRGGAFRGPLGGLAERRSGTFRAMEAAGFAIWLGMMQTDRVHQTDKRLSRTHCLATWGTDFFFFSLPPRDQSRRRSSRRTDRTSKQTLQKNQPTNGSAGDAGWPKGLTGPVAPLAVPSTNTSQRFLCLTGGSEFLHFVFLAHDALSV